MKKIEFIGMRFGRLVATEEVARKQDAAGAWRRFFSVNCDCGGVKIVRGNDLRSGLTRSCGCLQKENRKTASLTHGASRAMPEYKIWQGIKARCRNPKVERYPRYGGRGITICERWLRSFEAFYADMGARPSPKHQIDRFPDNDGNYEPGNCRWATAKEQGWSSRKGKKSAIDAANEVVR